MPANTIFCIPEGCTQLYRNALAEQSGLIELSVPASVRYISPSLNCINLRRINVDAFNQIYDSRNNCNAVIETAANKLVVGCASTTIPSTVKIIGSYAYDSNRNDENFNTLVIPNSVEEIQQYAFAYLNYLRNVYIGSKVNKFGYYIFHDCKNLEAIESLNGFPNDIGEYVFKSGSKDFSFYDNVTLYVPVGCRNNYRLATGWSNFKNIVEGSFVDGIENIVKDNSKSNVMYSPNGVRLSVSQKGINIINGKKLLMK